MKMKFISIAFVCIASASALAEQVSKENWVAGMSNALPAYFCGAEQPFRQCFKVSEAQCQATVKKHTTSCIAKFDAKIPALLEQPADGTKWGQVVGECVGQSYWASFEKEFLGGEKCSDVNAWK